MIRLRGLGQCTLEVGDTRLLPAAETMFATALYLVLEGGKPIGRRALMEVLWPTVSERRAAHSLRQVLYRLNGLGAGLRCERMDVLLPAHSMETDCAVLLATHDSVELERLAAGDLAEFLPGYSPQISAAYAEWLEAYRDRVHSAIRRTLQAGISTRRARGDWHGAELLAARCLAIDPLNEEATIAVAESAMAQRSRGEALSVLDTFLRDAGGVEREPYMPAAVLRERIADEARPNFIPVRTVAQTGREQEMAELEQALQLAIGSRGSTCLIWGETGIGKTRLVNEFAKNARTHHVRVVQVGCQPHDERRPLSVFVDLVPKLLELPGSLGCTPESMTYLKRLVEHDPKVTTLSPDSGDAELLFSNVCHSLFDLFDAVSGEGPLLLVMEDAHWLDRMSWEVLGDLTAWAATRQVLVLLTSRVEEVARRHAGGVRLPPLTLPLRPLRHEAARQLLDRVITGMARERNERFRDWCISSCGGNPYYLIELALHGAWDGEQYFAPATLDQLVAQRLSGLSPLSYRTLQASCSLGKFSTLERLERVLGARSMELMDSLEDLERRGLIESDGTRVISMHDLLTQAALSRLTAAARALMDRRVAQVLESDAGLSSSIAMMWECSEHWKRAGEIDRAIDLLRTCALHALEIGMPAEAARTLASAASLARSNEEKLEIADQQIQALHLAGSWNALESLTLDTMRLRKQIHLAESQHTDLELLLFQSRWRISRNDSMLLKQALKCVLDDTASAAHRVRVATWVLMLADNSCNVGTAHQVFTCITPLLLVSEIEACDRIYFELVYHCAFGEPPRAARAAAALLSITETNPDAGIRVRNLSHAAIAYRANNEMPRAIECASHAVELAEKKGMRNFAAAAANQIASIYLTLDNIDLAKKWNSRADEFLGKQTDALSRSAILSNAAEIALREGRLDDAADLIKQSEIASDHDHSVRATARFVSFRWHLRVLRGHAAPSTRNLADLVRLHERTRKSSHQDLFVAVLFRLFELRGRREEGKKLVIAYLSEHRRVKWPLSVELRSVQESVNSA